MYSHIINTCIALAAVLLALIFPKLSPIAGLLFALIGPLQFYNGMKCGKGITDGT